MQIAGRSWELKIFTLRIKLTKSVLPTKNKINVGGMANIVWLVALHKGIMNHNPQ